MLLVGHSYSICGHKAIVARMDGTAQADLLFFMLASGSPDLQ